MYDIVTKHKRIAQIVLALIALPFAFFGVDSYFRSADSTLDIATVAGEKITQNEFNDTLREQQERLRQQLGRNFDPAIFDNPEVRFQLLGQLVDQRLLQHKARQENFRVTDAQLQQFIADLPVFQENGRFSADKYRQLLAGQNMTPQMFEARVRAELTLAPLQEPVALGGIVARGSGERYLSLLEQQREIAIASVDAEPFAKDVKVDDAAIKAFYDANPGAFQTPEQAKIEFVTLTLDALMAQTTRRCGRGQGQVRRRQQRLHAGRGAPRVAHPDRGQARRQRCRQGRGEEEGGGARRAGQGEPGEVRRAREGPLAGPRLGGAGRRPRHFRAGQHGQAVRRRGVRGQARRDRRARCRRTSAGT